MKTKINLDEFLKELSTEGFLCTIETIQNDTTKVKLLPWLSEHEGCNCEASIVINKDLIENVLVTDQIHYCCGRKHKVIEVFFKQNASIKITDLIQMTISKSSNTQRSKGANYYAPHDFYNPATNTNPYGTSSLTCPSGWLPCGPYSCYNPKNMCCCCDPRGNCYIKDNTAGRSCYTVCGGPII